MKEELISFETAKLAKEKGFLLHTIDTFYQYDGSISLCHYQSTRALEVQDKERVECYAPTQSLLQKWLREKHNIYVLVDMGINRDYYWKYFDNEIAFTYSKGNCKTYEEALEIGLRKTLELIK